MADDPTLMEKIYLDMKLEECSFRAGKSILSPVCRLARTGRVVSLEFISFPGGEEKYLTSYIENLPMLELNKIKNKNSTQ